VNAGLRVRGGYSRSGSNPKHAFRLFFRSEYGDSSLDYPVFGPDAPKSFQKLDVRTAENYSWSFGGDPSNTMIQDGFERQSQGDMGSLYSHSLWVNLYLDGQYWGIYQIEERPEADFASTYLGGDANNYDVVKTETGPYTIFATNGNLNAYQNLWQYVTTENLVDNSAYYFIQGKDANGVDDPSIPNEDVLLDVDNLITYMIGILHSGNLDAPISAFLGNQGVNNFFAVRDRTGRLGFQYVQHDAEHTLHNINEDRNGPYTAGQDFSHFNPQFLHQQLMANAEYRLKFADAVEKDFFNDGPMTVPNSEQRFQSDVDKLNLAIIAESARWGDAQRPTSPLGHSDWLSAVAAMENFLANRTPVMLQQFVNNGLFPTIGAPQFLVNGIEQNSGQVAIGSLLRFAASRGLVYYTTDGSDPRLVGGGINPNALIYDPIATPTPLVSSGASWKYNDKGLNLGTAWSGPGFDDSSWSAGNAELGYGDGDEVTTVASGPGAAHFITTYFRKTFDVTDVTGVNGLLLRLKRDDGAVVYINGVEATRSNMPTGAVTWTTLASSAIGGTDEQVFNEIQINPSLLHNGTNTIAVEIHQSNATSSDISFDAELLASVQSNPGLVINSSSHILARAFDGTEWSPETEATLSTAVAATASNLAVTEIQYNPVAMPGATTAPFNDKENFEFIELQNVGTDTITLSGVRFITGITFDFSAGDVTFLAPGEHVVVVKNLQAFTTRYGATAKIAGMYSGNLSNGGEQIMLVDASNATIQDFIYDDDPSTTPPWPQAADGGGASLTVISTSGNYNLPSNWRASATPNGTPGYEENAPPTAISLSANKVDENLPNAVVGVLTATDANLGDRFTFTLTDSAGGTFAIDGSNLVVANGVLLDFETRKTYPISVRVTDAGGLTFDKNFTITVKNVDEAPTVIALSNAQINENQLVGTTIGTFTTTDPDAPQTAQTFTYSLLAGDTSAFMIDSTGNLKANAEFNVEAKSSYSITVRSTDQGNLTVDTAFTITVNNINEAPTAVTLSNTSVNEGLPTGTTVGGLGTIDPDTPQVPQTFTYGLVGGDISAFTIDGAGNLVTSAVFDFESKSNYSVVVRSTDQNNLSVDATFTITVKNVDETPTALTLSNANLNEGLPVDTVVGSFATSDPDAPKTAQTFTYTVVAGDTADFTIDNTGNLKSNTIFDFNTMNSYSITVRSTDQGGLFIERLFTITVDNVNEAPTNIDLSSSTIDENQNDGTTVGVFSTIDPDDPQTPQSFTYSLVAGDIGAFTVDAAGNLTTNSVFDFETQSVFSITVRSMDQGGLSVDRQFTISVANLNEAPTDISLSGQSVAENQPAATVVGSFGSTDPDANSTFTYVLVSGAGSTDNASFDVVNGQLVTKSSFDLEAKTSYSIRVSTTDQGGASFEKQFTINVTGRNESPTALNLSSQSVPGNQPIGTSIGVFITVDPDSGNTFTYSFVSGNGDTDNSSFTISNGVLRTASVFHMQIKSSYSILVRTTDQGGLTFDRQFNITVTPANEQPTDIALSSTTIAENLPTGSVVGSFTTSDPNPADSFIYSLVAGTGSTDNSSFTISNGQLRTGKGFDFETKQTYSILVRTTDQGGLTFDRQFTIVVTDADDAPNDIVLSAASINENQASGTIIGSFTSTDQDAGNTFTYSLVSGSGREDNASFTIDNGQLKSASNFDFETKKTYTIRVQTADQDGLTFDKQFLISVTDGNDAPTNIGLNSEAIAENKVVGSVVGTFNSSDPNSGNMFTYSLVVGDGSTDNGSFTILNNQLRTTEVFDYEAKSSYSILVRTTDQGGLTFDKQFTISITDANDGPTDLALNGASIVENQDAGTFIGAFSTTDPDAVDTFNYSLVAGAGSTDNASFLIANGQLKSSGAFDFEMKNSYSIRVRATDKGGLTVERQFTINVTDVNDAPTNVLLSSASIAENQIAGTTVGSLTSADQDAGNTFTYTLEAGVGSTENTSFTIVNGELRTASSFDFETKSSYSVRVRTTDQSGKSFEKFIIINVTDRNEVPAIDANQSFLLSENSSANAIVGTVTASDPDLSAPFNSRNFSITGGNVGNTFAINPTTGQLTVNNPALLDLETTPVFSLQISLLDGAGAAAVPTVVTIQLTNVNEVPTISGVQDQSILEDSATDVLLFNVADAETSASQLVVTATSSNQALIPDANIHLFGADAGRSVMAAPLANQSGKTTITLTVSDGVNTSTRSFVVTVTAVPDAPTLTAFQPQTILEDNSTDALAFTIGDVDSTIGSLNVTATSSNTAVVANTGIVINGVGTSRSLVVTPVANRNGTAVITVTVSDGVLTSSRQFEVTVTAVEDSTVIKLNPLPMTLVGSFKKGVAIDSAATISDVDTPNLNFNKAILQVTGQTSKDHLLILNRGNIGRKGKNIWHNGDIIGTVEGGKKGGALTVRLTAAATQTGVQDLLRSIGLKPAKHAAGTRTIHVQVSGINGTDTAEATRQIIVPG
jgi:hypothetical protein